MLHGSKLTFVMGKIFMIFSVSVSLTGLLKNEFKPLFVGTYRKCFFVFGVLDVRFEPTFTKKLLNVSAMEVLFAIIFLCSSRQFADVLALDFSVATDFIPSQVFLRFFEFL